MLDPFYGRERELGILAELLDSKVARLVVVRGRRRIGKSRLAEKFAESFDNHFIFVGLPPEKGMTDEMQRRHFANELETQSGLRQLRFDDWDFLFSSLHQITKKGKVLIILDEINWMGSLDASFLGKLKTAWDSYFKKNPKLVLLLSGSMSAWIEKHILRSTGFFGRIALDIVLQELPLYQCSHFWRPYEKNITATEKFKVLSVTGGIPLYLESINPKLSAEENIRRLCFRKEGLLFLEFERIFSEVFGARAPVYKKIITTLAHGPADQAKIFKEIETEKSGVYSEYLDELVKTGYLTRDYTWSLKSGKFSKLSLYRLCDNYLRFYLRYIEPNRPSILQNRDLLPAGWLSIMGLQFENLVLNNRQSIYRILSINPADIKIDNPYFQRGTRNKSGVQIDYMIQTRFNVVYICEIKFHRDPIGTDIIQEMQKKLKALKLPRGYSMRLVLIHVNGVKKEVEEQEFFSHIIDFSELLEK
ncbi:MAG TPA: ATP-binding protein [Rhabdochlamydiaceae bacterium]|nr:ATP-binding protein [Rhabdochlamydiaceae bacterium]